jgi:hypothetical protein
MALLGLSDHRSPIGSDTSRSVNPVGARHRRRRSGSGWLSDDRGSIGSNASRSVHPIGASGSVALLGESEHTKCNHDDERHVFHFNPPPDTSGSAVQQMPDVHDFRFSRNRIWRCCTRTRVRTQRSIFTTACSNMAALLTKPHLAERRIFSAASANTCAPSTMSSSLLSSDQ